MVQKLNYDELPQRGFLKLPELLYDYNKLKQVPNEIIEGDFVKALLIPEKGRLVLFHHPAMINQGVPYMTLGFFECIDDIEIARALFDAAREVAIKLGIKSLVGPMNGNTWNAYRFMESGSTPLFLTEYYHHHYYLKLWEGGGFSPIAKYFSSIDMQLNLNEDINDEALEKKFKAEGINIRSINIALFEQEIGLIHEFCSTYFANNFLFTPIESNAFLAKYMPIKPLIDPGFVKIAEDENGKITALFFAIPDIYNSVTPTLVVKTIVRNPSRKYAGIIHLLGNLIVKEARKKGYLHMIHAFMHASNTSNKVSKKFSGEVFRSYVLFGNNIK